MLRENPSADVGRAPAGTRRMRLGAVCVAAAVLLAMPAWRPAAGAEIPLFAGNTQIARDIVHGDAHLLVLGDSLQFRNQIPAYLSQWKPDQFSGQVVGPNLSSSFGFGNVGSDVGGWGFWGALPSWIQSEGMNRTPDAPPGPDGYAGTSPAATTSYVFNAVPVTGNPVITTFSLYGNQDAIYSSGRWADRNDVPISLDVLTYNNPGGMTSGISLKVYNGTNPIPIASIPISTYAATPGVVDHTVSFPGQRWDASQQLTGCLEMDAGTVPLQDSNVVFLGARFSNGQSGLQFASAAEGGKGIQHFLDPALCSDANLAAYLEDTDSNIAFVWLGQNGDYQNVDQWKALIARYKTARPDMRFVLVSGYDEGSANQPAFTQGLYDISQEDPSVLFLNLYATAGDYSFINANYLSDGIHQNADGTIYMADQLWNLIDQAAVTPEPASGSILMLGGIGLLLRRRHARVA
jgi:hypothetical protein